MSDLMQDRSAGSRPTRRRFLLGAAAGAGIASLAPALGAREPSLRARFFTAVVSGDVELVQKLLLRDPALLYARDTSRRSAYAVALLEGRRQVAELLLADGYRPDAQEAALALDWPRFEALAGAAPGTLNLDHPLGTAMVAAARGGAGRGIWRVYRYGGDPNARPGGLGTPSAVRVALEHPDMVTAEMTAATLLGNGASPNPEEGDGVTPLHIAAGRGSADLVEILIRKGARLDARDGDGRSAVDLAELNAHRSVVELLRNAARIPRDCYSSRRAYDVDGNPFHEPDLRAFALPAIEAMVGAAHFDRQSTLASVQAFPVLAKARGLTTEGAVEACAHTGRLPIVEDLLALGAPYSLPTAVMRGDATRVKELLSEDPQRIHERGAHDFALLWYPVIGGGLSSLLELLLDAGAEIEQQHTFGTTALHWAARSGQIEMVDLLCERGAAVDRLGRQFDPAGQTPLQIAQAAGHDQLGELLRARGATR